MTILLMLGILTLGTFSTWGFYQMGHSIRGVVEIDTPLAENISDIEILKLEQSVSLRAGVLEGMEHGPTSSGFTSEVSHFNTLNTRVDEELLHIEEIIAEFSSHSNDTTLIQVDTLIKKAEAIHHELGTQGKALFSEIKENSAFTVKDLDRHMERMLPLDNQLSQVLEESHRKVADKLHASGLDLENTEEAMLVTQLVLAVFFLVIGTVVSLRVYRSVMQQLGGDPNELMSIAKRISEGELHEVSAVQIDTSSGVMASMIAMQSRLSEVVSEAAHISRMVHSGANELSQGSLGLAERSEAQAATLETTAASSEEISSTVQSNVENAIAARTLAESTSSRAAKGGTTATDAVKAMEGISNASGQVSAIVGVIDEIAFQTNLLALNAAVEAARAGEQGRGFAVVATEVRQLAGRSASAAKEIKELIEENVNRVQEGSALVISSGDELGRVVESIEELNTLIAHIALASEEQSLGVRQINDALVQLDTSTQQNTTLVEESSTTSQNLAQLAEQLDQKIGFFQVHQAA